MNPLDDDRAVERVLAGDASGFSVIVQRWQGPLVNLAYRFCRDRARAEDMAQEAFVRAFRNLAMWRPGSGVLDVAFRARHESISVGDPPHPTAAVAAAGRR